ncbi:RNA polymerase sigma factor [Fusibacter sp. 3D3]|uniref:RNA polymerase sigma factor n=1 Tax=Fusibacter sp. 3D3 TaxID=1048380 RepID=UPI0008536029|nr:RNA polymerase sigma factor [Fusibacter sp. 3D3]GAU75870.1 RNA polymerase sigma-70 factor, ECF subfamily [Fusibacter sp. 3D3]
MLIFLMHLDTKEERDTLEKLYLKYHNQMFYIAHEILKDGHESQDVVQTAILKMVNYIDRIDSVDSDKTKFLIHTIVKNTAIDLYRKRKRNTVVEAEVFEDLQDTKNLPLEDMVIKLGEAKIISEKLAEIKAEYADILALKYYHEFDDQEIAEILSISHENVRVRLVRAKKTLKKLMLSEKSTDYTYGGLCRNEI